MHVSAASTAVHTGMMGWRGRGDRSEGEERSEGRSPVAHYFTYLKGTGNIRTGQVDPNDIEELETAIGHG